MVERIEEVHRLAQEAHKEAREAHHIAEVANNDIAAHEKLCSERYAAINTQLREIKEGASKGADAQKISNSSMYDAIHRIEVEVARIAASATSKTGTTDNLLKWGGWAIAGIIGLSKIILIMNGQL